VKRVKNILIFGAGSVGTHHANAARTLNCNVVICDINFSKFKYMKNNLYPKRYGSWDNKIKFISYKDIFETENNYDLIIIGVPPQNHLELLKKCFIFLKFKKILVEKPLCVFNQDFSFINKIKNKNKIYCGFNHSISDSFLYLINLVSKKRIGNIKKVEINWKEDFKLVLNAHPWIKNLKQSYLSNLKKGGGGCHEYSHALHLALILKKILFKEKKISMNKNIIYKKEKNLFYDSVSKISFNNRLKSLNLNIDTISNPCQKNITVIGENGTIFWERKIEKKYEKIEIKKNKNLTYKFFKLSRCDDFINQIKILLFKKKKYDQISNIKLQSGVEVMKLLQNFFKYV